MKKIDNKIHLMPGELVVTIGIDKIWTTLGSCISIVFYHRESGLCGMCHAQMPEKKDYDTVCSDSCPDPCFNDSHNENEFKYVSCSIRYMINAFQTSGISLDEIEVYLVGGSRQKKYDDNTFNIGRENIDVARKMLKSKHLLIKKQDVGGNIGRTIEFYPKEGNLNISYVNIQS